MMDFTDMKDIPEATDLTVIPVRTRSDAKKFIMLPWKIYRWDRCWVPPLISDVKKIIYPAHDHQPSKIECAAFLALSGGKPAGRILTGIDHELNKKKNEKMGYISLFECIDNYDAAKLLFDKAIAWLKERDIKTVRGPVSPSGTDNDEYKGLLINCFDRPPVFMNSYNPGYYAELFEKYGFTKDYDVFAYLIKPEKIFTTNPEKTLEYAKKRYNFRIDTMNIKNVEKEVRDIKYILDLAVPDEWPDMAAPSLDEVRAMAKRLTPVADPDLLVIARSGDEPVGFGITIPDYNQVLIHLNGRTNPISALKYLWYRRKIDCARFFIMFVVPAFRKKGVSYGIYYQTFLNGLKKGYKWGEGSTIGETNLRMRKDAESVGGVHYKTYRIFSLNV